MDQHTHAMEGSETATGGTSRDSAREDMPSGPSGAPSTPRTVREHDLPSEVSTPWYHTVAIDTLPQTRVQSKAGHTHRRYSQPSEENTERIIPDAGDAIPREPVRSKTGESYRHEARQGDAWAESETARMAYDERRQRKRELEREIRAIEEADRQDRMLAIERGTRGTREPEFDEWVRNMEDSMRHVAREDGTERGQNPRVISGDLHDTHTTNHQRATYLERATRSADATRPVYATRSAYATHSGYAAQPGYTHHATYPEYACRAAHPTYLGRATRLGDAPRIDNATHPGYNTHLNYTTPHHYTSLHNSTFLSQSQIAARQPIKKDLPNFSGDVESWPIFITAFHRTTATCGYTEDENVMRLQHALKGVALEMVGHLLAFPGGLDEAIATLQARFGRPDLIVEATINKIRSMPAPKVEKLTTLVEFGLAVKRLVAAVKASGLHAYMYDVALLKELVRKLPPTTCIDWARTRKTLPQVTLIEFGRWIGELTGDLCAVIDMAPISGTGETDRRKPEPPLQPHRSHHQRFQPHQSQPVNPQPLTLLDDKLNFKLHVDEVLSKSYRTLGFILRVTSDFKDPICLRSLYCCSVRSVLEYACVVWCPYGNDRCTRIEKLQKYFTRVFYRRLFGSSSLPTYETRCLLFGLESLTLRRHLAQACFIGGLLRGSTDAPELLASVCLYVPSRSLRPRDPLALETRQTLYCHNDPLLSCFRWFNRFYDDYDFNSSLASFRTRVLNTPHVS